MNTNHAKRFLGRVCTIFTTPINRNFKDENPQTFLATNFHYFMGKIVDIDDDGVLVSQVRKSPGQPELLSYFFCDHIVAIIEEEVVTDPKTIEFLKGVQQQQTEELKKQNPPELYLNPDKLQQMSQEMAKRFGK